MKKLISCILIFALLCSLSVSAFAKLSTGENAGAVAVIAPTRIDFKTVSRAVDFAAECVSSAIGELIEN